MRANQKLTHLIAGCSISGINQAGDVLTVTLDDGSVLTIKTAPSNTNAAATSSGKISWVRGSLFYNSSSRPRSWLRSF